MIRADLHIHTTFSDDSQVSPKTMVEKLVAHPSIKAAAVTDHDSVAGIETVRQLAKAYPDILIIPGVEISTPQGDIVILGTEQLPPKPWSVENVVDFAKDNNCISIAAHPYREYGMGDYTKQTNVDAIEVINGGSPSFANKQAHELAKLMKLPGTGGSDAHQPQELYTVYTEIQAGLNVDDILAAIRKGQIRASLT